MDSKSASEQLIISEQSKPDQKPAIDPKKLAALEKERLKAEKNLKEKLKKGKFNICNELKKKCCFRKGLEHYKI